MKSAHWEEAAHRTERTLTRTQKKKKEKKQNRFGLALSQLVWGSKILNNMPPLKQQHISVQSVRSSPAWNTIISKSGLFFFFFFFSSCRLSQWHTGFK